MTSRWNLLTVALLLGSAYPSKADGLDDNKPASVRRVPALGIAVAPEDRKALESKLADLGDQIRKLDAIRDPNIAALIPDVRIFHKAVHDALTYQEFFKTNEIGKARELLDVGMLRAEQLLAGSAPWASQTGLVVRGYVSRIDGSVQPYGLVIPGPERVGERSTLESEIHRGEDRYRLDVWFHGRGETLSEVNFLDEHRRQRGLFTPPGTIVLHPYGRYCNAFKFAGEVDVLEAIEAVRWQYRIDDDRISVRGFSMGGAAAWQFAVHYPDRWFAANPGAGFSETPKFLKVFQRESLEPTWYEQTLWKLYDCPEYAANLRLCPTIAYSGERDSQKQAADVMAEALQAEGIDLLHIIGPGKGHEYHPDSKLEVERRMASLASAGRRRFPLDLTFVTPTLKYNQMHWVTVDALFEHWKNARVRTKPGPGGVVLETENVSALTLEFPSGWAPFPVDQPVGVNIDGTMIRGPRPFSDRSWKFQLHRKGSEWAPGPDPAEGLHKRHDLQGPIDDAFMDSFVFVRPTGQGPNPRINAWVDQESRHATEHWRRQFRGEARVKNDTEVNNEEIASANLVLWGDPESNAVLKKIVGRLPISWDKERIVVGDRAFPSDRHVPVMIFPNPLNPSRYVVLNSGFTYREYDYLNNARQVPKLPDWAIVDVENPPDSRAPGAVVAADFFGERWELRPTTPGR
ncbi:prolyl oligopeptidase family serine peptidase [Singulisphaera rosea]